MLREPEKPEESWREYISPLRLAILAVNWICFCASIVLIAQGRAAPPLVVLLIGTGLCSIGGLIGTIVAARKRRSAN